MIPEPFWTAIEKGMLQITKGELRSLDMPEKRQLLADLRKRGDCPENWKNTDPKRQTAILEGLRSAIQRRLLKKEEYKKRSQKAYKKRKSSGKIAQAGAKRSKALHDAKARAIAECKDGIENVWEPEKLKKEVSNVLSQIVEKCGEQGFVHVFVGAKCASTTLQEAVENECFGRGRNRHAVFEDGRGFVRYSDVKEHVEILIPYSGTNCVNADDLERQVQEKLLDWPQHRRMFVRAGKGTCQARGVAVYTPFPYYTGVLVCARSMKDLGIRLATKEDHAPKKKDIAQHLENSNEKLLIENETLKKQLEKVNEQVKIYRSMLKESQNKVGELRETMEAMDKKNPH